MNKIRQYFSTLEITRGFFIALLSSLFIYLDYFGLTHPLSSTILGVASLYLLLKSDAKIWFWYGAFLSLFWFWWITVSLYYYDLTWAIPLEMLGIMIVYGSLLGFLVWLTQKMPSVPLSLLLKSIILLSMSYIHPFGFDWYKPELMFVSSYLGIFKWQFAIILLTLSLMIWKKNIFYLPIMVLAFATIPSNVPPINKTIQLVTTSVSAKDKWNKKLQPQQFQKVFNSIDKAIKDKKSLVIFPESVFPVFLNERQDILDILLKKSQKITIVVGGLHWENKQPHNSSYLFQKNHISIAHKVVLVPFGESNPLPDFLSDWVNEVFYDGAVDYVASDKVTDFNISGTIYRSAICFEASSERLYEKSPQNMIVISNNVWITPSIEPTLQRLLLQYYSKKYGTTIYHSINMSPSYCVTKERVITNLSTH